MSLDDSKSRATCEYLNCASSLEVPASLFPRPEPLDAMLEDPFDSEVADDSFSLLVLRFFGFRCWAALSLPAPFAPLLFLRPVAVAMVDKREDEATSPKI